MNWMKIEDVVLTSLAIFVTIAGKWGLVVGSIQAIFG